MKYSGSRFGRLSAVGLATVAILLFGLVWFAAASPDVTAQGAAHFLPFVGTARLPMTSLDWSHLSTATGDLPSPDVGPEQVAALVGDLDGDGDNDFVIASRRGSGTSIVWYQREAAGWTRRVVEPTTLPLEAGGALHDVDRDGDLDLVLGTNRQGNSIWWWENPAPAHETGAWTRRVIKGSGQIQHHDMMFGEFDGDAGVEFVFWNQGAAQLYVVEVPADPRATQPWPGARSIFTAPSGSYEGLAKGDVDGNGRDDIVAGGYWFSYEGGNTYRANRIDPTPNARVAVGQLKAGGWPEIVISPGDATGYARWYEWNGSDWIGHDLLNEEVFFTHSLELGDVNGDGALDIFMGEMAFEETDERHNAAARSWLFLGDGQGEFDIHLATQGFGHHESRLADLDSDGDLDILGKPFDWQTPRLDIWLNDLKDESSCELPGQWTTHLIDDARPWRAVFVDTADLDGDSLPDVISGAWWYRNPGAPGGDWLRQVIGAPLDQMAAVADFDSDGDADILGTVQEGTQPQYGNRFVWAQNDGAGNFTVHDAVATGRGDFLQGVAVGTFDGRRQVVLSWHNGGDGIETLDVPADPAAAPWPAGILTPLSQDEALSAGDIDGDGDTDLLLGSLWLENNGPDGWADHTLYNAAQPADRNQLADMDGDGDLDAVIGPEGISAERQVAWYEQPDDATALWPEHAIGRVVGPQSLDVGDIDGDGDSDVVVGEHNLADPQTGRVVIFENSGGSWIERVVATGHEHHDGAQLVDIDADGDLDIISIGWAHGNVLLYERVSCGGPTG